MTGQIKQREVLGKLAEKVAERSLATPAIFLLEAGKPLSFVGAQAMHFFEPFLDAFFPATDYRIAAEGLEDRENVEWLIQKLERAEESRDTQKAEQ